MRKTQISIPGVGAALVFLAVWPGSTDAHTIIPGVTGFQGGLLHPLIVPTHVMNIIVLGLLIGQRPEGERYALLATFAAGLIGAIVLVTLAFATDRAQTILLGSAIAGGITLASRAALPILLLALHAAIAAFALQLNSVPSSISNSETLLTLSGSAVAAFFEVAAICLLSARVTWRWLMVAIRVVGSWIAAIALLMLALTLR